jgi:anaerobic magnesium-protoporphyrin IX monomethyl ester cyclase
MDHMKTQTPNIVLFYPRLGWMDTFILDIPLSLIYVAHECRKQGIEVRILDQRVLGNDWAKALCQAVDGNTVLAGFSVMSGTPIFHALEATKVLKNYYPSLPVVWGGIHVTLCPESVIENRNVDYIVRGLGSVPLYKLVRFLAEKEGFLDGIEGLGWKNGGKVFMNGMPCEAAYAPLSDLCLDSLDLSNYTRFNYTENVYSFFSSFGCPHKCSFCFAPIFWKNVTGRKWFPYDAKDVIDHITEVVRRYKVGYLSLLDENFFLDLKRGEQIFRGLLANGVRVRWGIRGARIDDLYRMNESFLELLQEVGVEQIMIGAESGSSRMLGIMKKRITVEQTIQVNQRLQKYPKIKPSYNFLSGIPGETIDDMYQSVDLILRMMEDNPNASFSGMNQFIPFPGSELYEKCKEFGYREPDNLEEWAKVDTHYHRGVSPWLERKTENTLHAIQAALMFVDNKVERELLGESGDGTSRTHESRGLSVDLMYRIIAFVSSLYKPIARYRLKHHYFGMPIDYKLIKLSTALLSKVSKLV